MSKLFDWFQRRGGNPEAVCIGCNLWHELDGCLKGMERDADSGLCPDFTPPLENPTCEDCLYFDKNTHSESFGFLCHKLLWCQPKDEVCDHYRADCKDSRMYAERIIEKERQE